MEKSQERHAAKVRFVAAIQRGLSKPEAIQEMGLPMSRSTVFRLRQRVHLMGGEAAQDGRHGHPSKLRGEVRTFLEETRARKVLTRQVTRSKRSLPSVFPFRSV